MTCKPSNLYTITHIANIIKIMSAGYYGPLLDKEVVDFPGFVDIDLQQPSRFHQPHPALPALLGNQQLFAVKEYIPLIEACTESRAEEEGERGRREREGWREGGREGMWLAECMV